MVSAWLLLCLTNLVANDAETPRAEAPATSVISSEAPQPKAKPAASAAQKLPPKVRARLFLMLGMLVFVGLGLLTFVWLLGRAIRRYLAKPAATTKPLKIDPDDWASKPLVPRIPED